MMKMMRWLEACVIVIRALVACHLSVGQQKLYGGLTFDDCDVYMYMNCGVGCSDACDAM